jgi:NADPH-dependent curcumin reductase CurA
LPRDRLASRPKGIPTAANFTLAQTELEPLQDQQVLVRNLFMSVDPYMRGRMNEGKSYVPPFELGKPLDGGAVGEVIESRAKEFKPGDAVTSNFGWREYFIASPKELHPVSRAFSRSRFTSAPRHDGHDRLGRVESGGGQSRRCHLYFGSRRRRRQCGRATREIARVPRHRIRRFRGKGQFLRRMRLRYRLQLQTGPVLEQLNLEAPDGIDVYFDNVGGETLEAALSALRVHGRIIACGGISGYNESKPRPGPSNLFNMITKRLTMKGLIVRDWLDRQAEFEKEVGGYFKAGKLKNKETVVEGIDKAVGAFIGLFHGQNIGKMVVSRGTPASRLWPATQLF